MPLTGEYEPSVWPHARDQVDLFETSQGTEGNTLMCLPVVIWYHQRMQPAHPAAHDE